MLLVCLLAASVRAESGMLSDNLIRNGSFEEWTEEGSPAHWQVQAPQGNVAGDGKVFALGRRAARLTLEKAPGNVQLMSTPAPASPRLYFVRFAFRVVGLTKGKSFAGGQADMQLRWLDASKRVLKHQYVAWTYYPRSWSYRDLILRAPPGTAFVQTMVSLHGNPPVEIPSTAWFDDVAVCPYHPPVNVGGEMRKQWSASAGRDVLSVPGAKAWFYLAGNDDRQYEQAERVRDEDAVIGASKRAKPGVRRGIVYHTPYTTEQPPGLYRAIYRIKVAATAETADATKPFTTIDVISSSRGARGNRALRVSDCHRPGAYEDFAFDFVKAETGWLAFRVATEGSVEFFLDHIRVVQLHRFSDPDLLTWYPGIGSGAGANQLTLARGKFPSVLIVQGLNGDAHRVDEAVAAWPGCRAAVLAYSKVQSGPRIEGFPQSWEELRGYDVVVFANASFEALGPKQRLHLARFIEAGGGLVVMGGKASYGNGGVRGSFLQPVLPVSVADSRFDLVRVDGLVKRASPLAVGNPLWPKNLVCPWVHEVEVKRGATVSVSAGATPLVVCWQRGGGRVVCFVGAPYGVAPRDRVSACQWKDWPLLLRNVLRWASGRG